MCLGAFVKLRKQTVSCHVCLAVCFPVCPSVRMEQLASNWVDFYEIWFLPIFRKPVDRIQDSYTSDKNNGYLIWRPMHIDGHIMLYSS